MRLLIVFWSLAIALCRPALVSADFRFSGGTVETRAYSGLSPEQPIDRHVLDVNSLPFDSGTMATAGATWSQASYHFFSTADAASFRWIVSQAHDGASTSFGVAEGALAFQVDEITSLKLSGDYAFSGPGVKRVFIRLYDSPLDAIPVFQWDQGSSQDETAQFTPAGTGELVPGVGYRLVFRLLLDNRALSASATASANIDINIGASDRPLLLGDTDGNGQVDIADLNHVRNNFGQQGAGVLGDTYPFDGQVDLLDLNAIRNHFGEVRAEIVPEPPGCGLLVIGLGALAASIFCSTGDHSRGMMRSSGRASRWGCV